MAEPKIYISAGLPALDSAGALPTDDVTRIYITAGLTANDYAAAPATLEINVHDCTDTFESLH